MATETKLSPEEIKSLNSELETMQPFEILQKAWQVIGGEKVISLSMQLEDNVILDMILKNELPVRPYTLDTGRMHPETYLMIDTLKFKYDINIEVYYPQTEAIQQLVGQKGMYSFRESIDNRKECCHIRKVEPNNRALAGASLWVNGIRRDQSEERADTPILSYDEKADLYKLSPIAKLTFAEVRSYAKENKVPIHKLYEQGFASIGCAPCTRAIEEGEHPRAGRWWWEHGDTRECGLHA